MATLNDCCEVEDGIFSPVLNDPETARFLWMFVNVNADVDLDVDVDVNVDVVVYVDVVVGNIVKL